MMGSGVSGAMVCTPLPGILNSMTTSFVEVSALASMMACRSEPGPLSAVLVTVSGAALANGVVAAGSTGGGYKEQVCRFIGFGFWVLGVWVCLWFYFCGESTSSFGVHC